MPMKGTLLYSLVIARLVSVVTTIRETILFVVWRQIGRECLAGILRGTVTNVFLLMDTVRRMVAGLMEREFGGEW